MILRRQLHSSAFALVFLLQYLSVLALDPEVNTTHGTLRGVQTTIFAKSLDVFYGVPFAKPPVGSLRFKRPVPADHWGQEVKLAQFPKSSCFEVNVTGSTKSSFLTKAPDFSEDCLYMNIWAPAGGRGKATLVWIYGGGFIGGSINYPLYQAEYLAAENDVIVASMNYRLGPMGFMYYSQETAPGNMGLLDQMLAMKWLYENIEKFGGDKNRITIFGESAGAVCVNHHLFAPLSQKYFSSAIIESGSSLASWAVTPNDIAREKTKTMAKLVSCPTENEKSMFECLLKVDGDTLIKTQLVNFGSIIMRPVVDGYFLKDTPRSLLQKGEIKKASILLGVTKDEGTLFLYLFLTPALQSLDNMNWSRNEFNFAVAKLAADYPDNETVRAAVIDEYEYSHVPSLRPSYLDLYNDAVGDSAFNCPAIAFAGPHSAGNDVYLYSYEHRASLNDYPKWMGVMHGEEIHSVFGHPLNDSLGFTEEEKSLSRNVMKYWTNFAKAGDPNSNGLPHWPKYTQEREEYQVLDTGNNLTTKQGLRHRKCMFWEKTIPLMLTTASKAKPKPDRCVSGGTRNLPVNIVVILAVLLYRMTAV